MEPPRDPDRTSLTSDLTSYPGSSAAAEARVGAQGTGDVTTKGTVALVLSILPIVVTWFVAIGLAISALRESRPGAAGRGLATSALVISGAWVVIGLLVVLALPGDPERAPDGSLVAAGNVRVDSLRAGDCLPGGDETPEEDEEVLTVAVVPCEESHREEVYADFELPAGDFPGDDEVARLAEGGCLSRFEDFAGETYEESDAQMFYYTPTAGSWPSSRAIACIIATEEPVRGSLEGAGGGEEAPAESDDADATPA